VAQIARENPDSLAGKSLIRTDEFGRKVDTRRLGAAKRGLWIFDEIYRNSPERIAASEAGRQGAQTRQGGPLEEQLRRVAGNIEKLDPVENSFYQNDFERATDFLENSGLNDEEKRLAQQIAQDKIVLAYEKIARSSRGAPFRTEGRDQIAKRLTEVLAELRAEELAQAKDKALSSIYGDVRGSKEIRSAQTRVNRLTGKALGSVRQQSPERSLEKLGTSQRSLTKNPNEVQKQAFEDLENFLEGQALSGRSREEIEKQILGRIEKGTSGMLNKAKTILEKEFTEGLKGRERGEVVRAINQVADRYRRLGRFNPIGIATRAAFSAKRSIRRDAANSPIERGAQAPQGAKTKPPEAIGQREQAGDKQTGTGERTEDSPFEVLAKKEEGQSKPANTFEDGQERFTRLSNEDIDLILRSRGMLENERGGQIRGQISNLTSAQKKRVKQLTNYLIGKTPYETIYPESANRGGDTGAVVADADAGQRRTGEVLSGATQSVARRAANPNPPRGSDRVGGRNQGAAGTVQTSPVQRDGGSGVPAPLDPQAVRARARATTRRFVQSFARLTDAELTALSDAELDRARQAILNERDPAEALANRVAIGSTAASVADLARLSGLDLLRGAAAEIAREQADRDAVNTARENLGALLRSGAFADANSFIDSVASNTRMPRDMAIRAKEFAKLAQRGIDFNNVGVQIGRFGADTSWAGLTTGADGSYNIAINLDAVHDRDSVVNTVLHELQHVVLKEKVARRIPLNRVEQEALDRLEGIRRDTVVRAARDRGLNVPDQPSEADVARLSEELYDLSDPSKENSDRALASLRNLDEFVVEVSSNPELADLMVRLGYGQGKGQVTMLGALKNAWDSLVQFIAGIKADPNSPLAKAFKDSWVVSFANAGADLNMGEYTIPEVRRTAMADELARLAEINAFIDARVQQDNLAGTTEERNRLLVEWSKLNSNPKTAPARKARKKAAKQKKAQAVKQAEPEPKPEPPKKAEPKKTETKKDEPPKKTEVKKETPQKPPEVKKAVKTAKTKTVKPQSPASTDNELDEAANTLSQDDFVKWTKDNGYAIGDDPMMARLVYKSKRLAAGVSNNPTPAEQATGDTVQVAESRARGSQFSVRDIPLIRNREDARRIIDQAAQEGNLDASQVDVMKQALDILPSEAYSNIRLLIRKRPSNEERRFLDMSRLESFLTQGQVTYLRPSENEAAELERTNNRPIDILPSPREGAEPIMFISGTLTAKTPSETFIHENGHLILNLVLTNEERAQARAIYERIVGPSRQATFTANYVGSDADTRFEEWFAESLVDYHQKQIAARGKIVALNSYDRLLGKIYKKIVDFFSSEKQQIDAFFDGFYAAMNRRRTSRENITPNQVLQSRARGRVWRPVTRRTPTGGTITQGGMFAVDELLDKKAGDLYRSSRMAIKVDVATIQDLSRLLERQMKKFYKGQTPPVETINTALGNLDNPLTSEQIAEIEQMRANGKTNAAAKKRDQYIRDNRRNFKQNKQTQALAQLPEELAATIREMSSHIESLSRRLPNEGLVNGDLAITVDEALGTYLNRSYAIFDDPQWADRVRKDPKVMDAARKYISSSLVKDKTTELIATAAEDGRTLSREDALVMANDSVTEDEVENLLEGYLAVGQEAPTIEVLSGRIPGQKNLSMFYQRGNIAPEIQALWGRYEDPKINYAKTVMKLSSVIANDNFLKELRDIGIEEGWLWSRENNPDDTRHPPGYVRISTEKNPSLTPLGGMYAHPMLAEGLFKMFPVGGAEEHYWWLRSAMKLTGISMATKTVGSVASQIRNYLGNYLNLVATGNLGLGDIAPGSDFWQRFKNSNDTVLANTFGKYRNMSRAEWRTKIDDYISRGIVGESITTGLLEDLLTASRRAGSPDWGDYVWNKVGEPFKKVTDFAVRTYSSGDDWFKVMIYEAEQDKYRQAYPDWDDNKVREKAAEIARDIHWTYSLAPSIVQDLKKFPFIAPFVTFTSEVIRTTYNLQKLARQEIMEGRATGNKELEAIGWKRVRGMTTAAFLPLAVGSASMAMAGISGEDEEDLRRFLPDWQKNSQLLLFRKENGEVDFVDVSFLDPYEYFKKPLYAFMRSLRNADSADDILLKGTMDMVRQALDPFTSEQIFSGAIMDVMRNRDAAGRQVYNPQDTGANIGLSVARKIFYDPFIPGTVNSVERIGKAAFGIESETGRAYNLFNEIGSVVAGQRVSSVDAQQALQFKSSRFMREIRDASSLFNREFTTQGTRSAGDVVDGYERSNAARRSLIDSIRRDYLAAIRLGVPVQRAKAILRDGGLGGDTIKMVTTGIYKPYNASEQSLDLVRARGKSDRISAYNQARRSAAPREILADR
jgi:outer membrane biosynthesis protein TonB